MKIYRDSSSGIMSMDFTLAGGGFPVHLTGTGVVGSVTVSGIPQREDHGFVVECIATFLGIDSSSVALAKDDA